VGTLAQTAAGVNGLSGRHGLVLDRLGAGIDPTRAEGRDPEGYGHEVGPGRAAGDGGGAAAG
jgi:hypothetical protein